MSGIANQTDWTTPGTLRDRLRKRWDRGDFLSAAVAPPTEPLFPLRIPLKGPTAQELSHDFASAREWIAAWQKQEAVQLEWRQANHRLFGQNAIPAAAMFEQLEQVVRFVSARRDWERFQLLMATTEGRLPMLVPWLARRPFQALELAGDWERLLGVVEWLRHHPRPGIYVRQMRLPGVHTKFVESHRKVLAEWLDLILPPEAVDPSAQGAAGFNRRYGFRDKPERVRIRFLDSSKAPVPETFGLDLTLDAAAFARLAPAVRRVFITENEINFLAFPEVPDSLMVFGCGYGWSTLADADWLHRSQVFYWGDIDTHGFAILDQLRLHLPGAESFLMDRATLEAFQDLWGREPQPTRRDLPRLNPEEQALYNDLRQDRLAPSLRLEQERIAYSWLTAKLTATVQLAVP
jgi:hypothetical protein